MADYVRTVKGLLRGDTVEYEGGKMRMMHPEGFGAARPIEVPFLLGAAGPKGIATAREVAEGVFIAGAPGVPGFDWEARLMFGTVLDDGETDDSPRVMEAAGHGAAVPTTSSPRTACRWRWCRGARSGRRCTPTWPTTRSTSPSTTST